MYSFFKNRATKSTKPLSIEINPFESLYSGKVEMWNWTAHQLYKHSCDSATSQE